MDIQCVAVGLNGDATQELLHPDLHISNLQMTRELGVGRLTGAVPPESLRERNHNKSLILQEWRTAIYVLVDGVLFDAFIVTAIIDSDTSASIDAVGFLGYLSGMPYRGTFSRRNIHAPDCFRQVLTNVQGWGGSNLGLVPRFHGEFPRLGNPEPERVPAVPGVPRKPAAFTEKQPTKPKRPSSSKGGLAASYQKKLDQYNKDLDAWRKRRDKAKETERDYKQKVKERERAIKEREKVLDDAAYKLAHWSDHDMLNEFQSLLGDCGAQVKVTHTLNANNESTHYVDVFGDSIRRNTRVEFVDGENVMVRPKLTRGTEKQAQTVQVYGAGEGSKMVRSQWGYEAGGKHGLRRVVTHVDKTLRSPSRVSAVASALVRSRKQWWEYDSLTVINSALAPIGAFDVGDEVLYRTLGRRGVEHESWVLVSQINIDAEKGVMDIRIEPVGEVSA